MLFSIFVSQSRASGPKLPEFRDSGLRKSDVFYQTLSQCCGSGTINSESELGSGPKLKKNFVYNLAFLLYEAALLS